MRFKRKRGCIWLCVRGRPELDKASSLNLTRLPTLPHSLGCVCAKYPDLLFLMMAALVFMLSNACCERGFSMQNIIKGEHSTRMENGTLGARMRIAIEVSKLPAAAVGELFNDATEAY